MLSSSTPVKPIAPIIQTPPAQAEKQNASENSQGTQNAAPAASQPTDAKTNAASPPPPPPAKSAQPSQNASKSAEAQVVGNAVSQDSAETTEASLQATPTATESDRLKEMRAALAVVTELAENPVSERIAQLFEQVETTEADTDDSTSALADDPQSSIRSEQAQEGYATTRALTEDQQAA